MPLQGGNNGISCKDCYFFQEQLCARTGSFVACANFRSTIGAAPRQPQQAQLVPLPQTPVHHVEELRPERIAAADSSPVSVSVTIPLQADGQPAEQLDPAAAAAGQRSSRTNRVARRIAERYPQALKLC